jgi:hypothetical protein
MSFPIITVWDMVRAQFQLLVWIHAFFVFFVLSSWSLELPRGVASHPIHFVLPMRIK